MPTNSDPNKTQSVTNVSELALLIQLMGSVSSGISELRGLLQTINSTMALVVDQLITTRQEWKQFQKDTLETRALRSDIDIKALEAKDKEYELELQRILKGQESVKLALEDYNKGRGQTEEKMKAIVKGEISADKVDIRGVKVSSRQFTYMLIALAVLIALAIIFLPEAVSQILIRLAGAVPNGQP